MCAYYANKLRIKIKKAKQSVTDQKSKMCAWYDMMHVSLMRDLLYVIVVSDPRAKISNKFFRFYEIVTTLSCGVFAMIFVVSFAWNHTDV